MIAEKASVTAKMCAFARAYHATMARQKIFDIITLIVIGIGCVGCVASWAMLIGG